MFFSDYNIMFFKVLLIVIIKLHNSYQDCQEEVSKKGIRVVWYNSPSAKYVNSVPVCYYNDTLITRHCENTEWIPSLDNLPPCTKVIEYFNLSSCPPGYLQVSKNNSEYCYEISKPSEWNYPCFKSGGATIITDLNMEDLKSLLQSLIVTNTSRYFWLPAQRQKVFNPVVWYTPGLNWGKRIETGNFLEISASIWRNCLLLDIHRKIITTEYCYNKYPSLCLYRNDIHYSAKCPEGYHAFRFMPDNSTCFGIEEAKNETGLTFNEFITTACKTPMNDNVNGDLRKFIFKYIANLNKLPNDNWCWFKTKSSYSYDTYYTENHNALSSIQAIQFEGVINNVGALSLVNKLTRLPCMACETEIIFRQTELMFEYDIDDQVLYLTVYFPSGLWKYNRNDKGIQCFTNGKGFVKVVDVNNYSDSEELTNQDIEPELKSINVETTVYTIRPITDRSAQYWCEGHTNNFSLITTNKIILSPLGNKEHVFALVLKTYMSTDEEQDIPDMTVLTTNITNIFNANKALVMDILEFTEDYMLLLFHLHIGFNSNNDDKSSKLQEMYENLKYRAEMEFPKYNYSLVNISSSMYCLPTTTVDFYRLDWELTPIGHIAAPKQFCLQINGLPVKRNCCGSFLLGGAWCEVDGHCNKNYEASSTTEFLYNFLKGQIPENYTSRFLIDGLGYVLSNIDIIIPADIFYLSMSLQHVINIAHDNESIVDMGDIENMAWVMDRIMALDGTYLRLAQTLNSTNVILDSISNIIEILAHNGSNTSIYHTDFEKNNYQLAIKPQFIVQISYPHFNNITGIAVVRNTESNYFTDMTIIPLYKNTTFNNVLSLSNLEVATWFPNLVLQSLKKTNNESTNEKVVQEDIHIVISIYHNDAVFQELGVKEHTVDSRIIEISVPGYKTNLDYPVPLIFHNNRKSKAKLHKFCGFWDFQPQQLQVPGSWAKTGCYLSESIHNITLCECYHLTHFGQLLNIGSKPDNNNSYKSDTNHTKALNLITVIGSFLSLIGVFGIWITALIFKTWRKKAGTKVLLQLSTSIALPLIFIVVFNLDNTIFVQSKGQYVVASHMKGICIALGALLHYSILSSFMWMLIAAILQFVRYVRVLGVCRPSRFMIKFTLVGWVMPSIPVIILLILQSDNYIPNPTSSYADQGICYPKGLFMIFGVIIPISIILLINITLFVLVIYAISRGPNGKMRATDMDLIGAQLRLSIFLFFLLGLTWLFGIFSFTSNLIWSYLFCLTSTLQGFVLFVYFIVCDPNTRSLWITLMTPQFGYNSSRESITSISSG